MRKSSYARGLELGLEGESKGRDEEPPGCKSRQVGPRPTFSSGLTLSGHSRVAIRILSPTSAPVPRTPASNGQLVRADDPAFEAGGQVLWRSRLHRVRAVHSEARRDMTSSSGGVFGLVVIWLVLSAVVGYIAGTKHRSSVGWFIGAILISPLVAGIVILVIPASPDPQAQLAAARVPVIGLADEVAKLAALRDTGTITEDEFQRQRALLLPPPVYVDPRTMQVPPGMLCGKCGKPLSPVWKGKCEHCKATYADYSPVPRT